MTGNYTIDGTQDTGLNLNGHSIKGTVTVKAAAGSNTTTLSNTKNTTTASIDNVVAYKGAKLAGSGFPAVIGTLTLAEGAKWKDILQQPTRLGFRVKNADGIYKWYAPNDVKGSQLNNVIINSLPITSKILNLKVDGKNLTGNSPKVERGTTVQLCASCNAKDVTVTFSILKTGETTPITLTEPSYSGGKYTKDYSFDTIGEYTIYFTATKDGYTVTSNHKKLTVTKPNLSNAEITFRSSNESTYEPYRSTTTAPGFTVTYNGKTLKLGVDYTASGTASSAGVSTQTLTIKAVEGSDYTGSKTAEWRIVPHKAKVEVGDVIKAYDGTTDLPDGKISLVSAAGSAGYQAGLPLPLSEGNGFELTDAKYDSANASETEKNISFTVKLTDTNYTFEDGTTEKAFMKKFLSLFLCLTCVLTLVACGKKVVPITLPQTDEITSIDITFGENTVSHSDKTWISEIIADISSSEPTKKESVQDCPQVESYIKIDFQFETGTSTIFAYEDSGKYYIEQPYQGIYKIDSQLFERLQETD